MPNLTIRFVASPSLVGWPIRKLTGSLFQHVEFGTPDGTWIGAHIQGGIQERSADYCKPTLQYVYGVPCAPAQLADHLRWMRAQIGTKYNVADIIGLALQIRKLTSPHQYICSQFCTTGLLRLFGAKKVLNVQPEWTYRITPETLHLSPLFVGNRIS